MRARPAVPGSGGEGGGNGGAAGWSTATPSAPARGRRRDGRPFPHRPIQARGGAGGTEWETAPRGSRIGEPPRGNKVDATPGGGGCLRQGPCPLCRRNQHGGTNMAATGFPLVDASTPYHPSLPPPLAPTTTTRQTPPPGWLATFPSSPRPPPPVIERPAESRATRTPPPAHASAPRGCHPPPPSPHQTLECGPRAAPSRCGAQ